MDEVEKDLLYRQQSTNMAIELHGAKRPNPSLPDYDAWKDEQNRLQRNFETADKRLSDYQEEKRKAGKGTTSDDTVTVNGKLVNRTTGEVIGDYSDPKVPGRSQGQVDASANADVLQSQASAASSSATAALTSQRAETERLTRASDVAKGTADAALSQAKLDEALQKLRAAEIAQERIATYDARIKEVLALPPETPNRSQLLQQVASEVLVLSDPVAFAKETREQAKAEYDQIRVNQQAQRDADRFKLEQDKFAYDKTQDTANAERQEREGVATGVRDLLKLENTRASDAASTRTQHMKSGLGSLRDVPEFQRMQQDIDPQMAAQAVGMDPNSPKFQAIWSTWNQRGQSGQPDTQPPQMPGQPQTAQDLGGGMAQNVQGGMNVGSPYDIQEPGGNLPAAALQAPAVLQGLNAQPQGMPPEEPSPLETFQRRPAVASLYQSVAM